MNEILVDGVPVDYSGLPEQFRGGMRRYLEAGIKPGDALTAILCNNLRAVLLVDDCAFQDLPKIYRWMVNHAPSGAWGSSETMRTWMHRGPSNSPCPWCAQGNPRSSVSEAYVHTDTPLGRVVCTAEKPGA